MIAHTSGFKNAITSLGRDINVLIDYYSVVYNLKTEDDKLIITQDNLELLTEEMETQEPTAQLTNDDILRLNKNNLGELFRTYMKSFDLETTHKFNVGDRMIIKIGTTVNGEIEYLNYGRYYVYQRQYNEDKKTYTYTLCDRMLFTMIKYDNDTVFGDDTSLTCLQLINSILTNLCGFTNDNISIDTEIMANYGKAINKETLQGVDLTCRDVLDMIIQLQGCSLTIGYNKEDDIDYIETKTLLADSVDTIDEDILKDSNIKMTKQYGPINSLLFSRSNEIDNIERKDQSSIEANGMTRYVIKDNLILDQDNRDTFIQNLFDLINGISYYIIDIDTIGLGYLEYLDIFTVKANNNLYETICLKNTGEISNGMSEAFTTEEAQETQQTFENIGYDDKVASITMDKLKGQIVLKTDSDGKLAQVRLDSSGDEGSLVEISADNIKLEGYTTINGNFNIDNSGDMQCTNATITNTNITNATITDGEFKMIDSINQTDILNITKHLDTDMDLYFAVLNMNRYDGTQTEIRPGYAILTGGTYGDIILDAYAYAYGGPMIYCSGDVEIGGNLYVSGSKNRVVDAGDKNVLMNAYETTTPYFADIGSKKTNNKGECKIEIDKTFIKTIEEDDYKVFVQECGEGNLYVEKHEGYFIVKGTPNLDFDYEIKGIQKGYKDIRMKEIETLKGGNK